VDNLEGERLEHNNSVRTPMNHGIFMAFGSDNHPIGPMPGLYAATTRRGRSGHVYSDAERISMTEALIAYTRNGAYFTFEEKLKGTIEAGKLADIVVFSDDLLEIDPDRILDTKVDLTILGGRIVYRRPGASPVH
jgi:predicted amidohydrolase YtcJ